MKLGKLLCCLSILLMVLSTTAPARAGMVGTAELQLPGSVILSGDISTQREWIETQLLSAGVASAEASARVGAMTDAEVAGIYRRIDAAPAGGADILVIALVVFAVLEITGYIDVIPER